MPNPQPLKLGFLASGNGSSAMAVIRAIRDGGLAAEARLLVSNKRDAPALAAAAEAGVPTLCLPTQKDPAEADRRLADAMASSGVQLIVLSGYLRKLGPQVLGRYSGRILNIHPGPLPQFGGQGMYGRRVHEAVIGSGAKETAIVIHAVDEEYDHGPEVARRIVPIQPGESAETLEGRVKALEPQFFVETLIAVAQGRLKLPA
jgi:phosphoribosylglycinamide formyltransferase-1